MFNGINHIHEDLFDIFWGKIDSLVPDNNLKPRLKEALAADKIVKTAFGKDTSIGHTAEGKPYLISVKNAPGISITHGGGIIAVAWSYKVDDIGIDIEKERKQLLKVFPKFLRPEEYPEVTDLQSLFKLWTEKEAAWKALKNQPPSLIDVNLSQFIFSYFHLPDELLLTVAIPK